MKILILLFTILVTSSTIAQEAPKKVFISETTEHPALAETIRGIIDGLEQYGYKRGVNLEVRVESAQANPVLASQIASKFISQKPDVLVGVGTPSAQSLAKYGKENKAKIIFSSITDPLQAGLVLNYEKPGYSISGVSNFVELAPQIELFKQLQPNLKRLGVLYNPGEINSVSIVKRLETLCPKLDIQLIKQTVTKTAEVPQAATKLATQVNAIFISNDNTSLAAFQNIAKIARQFKIPAYGDPDSVALGALAAIGPNQYQVGLQTGKMIADSLKGKDIRSMPVEFPKKMDLYLNEEAANVLNINIPKSMKDRATKIIRGREQS